MAEKNLLNGLLLSATKLGSRLFRNNTGLGWTGKKVADYVDSENGRTITLTGARPLRAGLVKGSSDLIGWTPITITPDMVGKTVAIFTSIEAKTKGVRLSRTQIKFIDAVRNSGGIAGEARSAEDAGSIIQAKIQELNEIQRIKNKD